MAVEDEVGIAQVHLYTMRELNQDTAGTIQRINETNTPGIITRHGRFVAVIHPLANTPIESVAIANALKDIETRNQLVGDSTVGKIYSAEEAANELNLTVDVREASLRELGPHKSDRRSPRRQDP
ncbi:hypothetical protein AU192_16405 [Mycobacterium numidiamassiliense]|uniref:Antitoxin n=1 Tax=Mycobacterium numidiamassiliense TaxID=1841861 RepID=A0A2U3P9V7_9MYCO|nr:hypothetical protein [Mycobacterium numidiamassiliense]SPM40547.1 hypothetical protein AU192_16405 [Mycobacterium numidiamassiliense]